MSKVGMQQPTWLDQLMEKLVEKGDAHAIAQVIANSPQVMGAIKRGLANRPKPGVMGPSYAQNVAKEVREAIAAL